MWQKGTLVFQENVHLGTLRVMESFNRNQRSSLSFPAAVGEYLHSMLQPLEEEVRRFNVKYFVLSGDEPREIANLMGFETHGQETMSLLPQQFEDFVDTFHGVTATKLVNRYGIPEYRANILMPTIVLYSELLKMVRPQSLLISPYGFCRGCNCIQGRGT